MEKEIKQFRKAVWHYWKKEGRHELPWRKTHDPYKILVSEVMLQQTQVPRVIEKYTEFLSLFPTVHVLAHATLRDVLRVWSGLGYNRRGKYLHDAAKVIAKQYDGDIKAATAAEKLPGMGPYTRAAVRVFAFNEPHTLLETNVRAAFIHHFESTLCKSDLHKKDTKISDKQLVPLMKKAAEDQDPREWHWALMDFGVHIKKLHKNPARRSATYTKQSTFKGSLREVRGILLKSLSHSTKIETDLYLEVAKHAHIKKARVQEALESLVRDGLIKKVKGKWRIA